MRRAMAAGAGLLALGCGAVLALAPEGRGVPGNSASPLPLLGVADPEMVLMGSAPQGEAGETWGYRRLPLAVSSVRRGGRALEFGPAVGPRPEPQLAFERATDATGWQVYDTPVDEQGAAYRGPNPNPISAAVTPGGGGVLIGRDSSRPSASQAVVLARDPRPGARYRVLPAPGPGVLLDGESVAGDRGTGTVADTAVQRAQTTEVYVAPQGPDKMTAILRWDGATWTREPIDPAPGDDDGLQVLRIAGSGPDDVWALASVAPSTGRGVVLLHREGTGADARWERRSLGNSPFADRETAGRGITELAPLGGAAGSLSVSSSRVWVDGTFSSGGARKDFTLAYDPSGGGSVSRSWCDDAVCDAPLNAGLARTGGYRSFAFAGAGDGARIVTNPLDVGQDEETNRGTYLRYEGGQVRRLPGAGGSFRRSGAFASPDSGWLEGPVQISGAAPPSRLNAWPVALRAPLAAVTAAPASAPGSLGSQALTVGSDGSVARYSPGRGWLREFLLTSSGAVSKDSLRGVAWPERGRAHAVGDIGAMWQWNADNNLWEPDPGAPVGFDGNLMDVAFQPADPDRGFAVGKGGVILSYGKSWDAQSPPPGYANATLSKVAFAGSQALVAAGTGLLTENGGGWQEDQQVKALLNAVPGGGGSVLAVAGLPDGGAVAAGRDFVIERDSAGAPWRLSDQPLPNQTVIALGAFRENGAIRAVASVVPQLTYPIADSLPIVDENSPPPIAPPFPLPGDGYVLRENANGWQDEQRANYAGSDADRPVKSDPILGFDLDGAGNGWAAGGWSGEADAAGRGTSARNTAANDTRARVQTGGIYRYGADAGAAPPAAIGAPVQAPAGPVRLAVGGNARCENPCADLREQALGPDRVLTSALAQAAQIPGAGRPRAFLYTGGRERSGLTSAGASRYAELLGSQPGVPAFPAVSDSDTGSSLGAFQNAFSAFPAPFGGGGAPAGISSAGIPGAGASGTRTHYAFDSSGSGGTVRVVVIDNSQGSLAASDAQQNPPEPQRPWLIAVLADAKAKGIPVVVMGNRDLNTLFQPRINAATDGTDVARLLVDGGASAYVFDRPEENRALRIPAGSAQSIPAFASGTLGYRSPLRGGSQSGSADSLFGQNGFLLLELDASKRNPASNRAPVSTRLIPVVDDLSLEAVDGTLLRRSRPALFRGLGRRPLSGDRWGRVAAGDGNPNPPGGDPYTPFPADQCTVAGCSTRIDPEYAFTSSDPDIADFVRQDPNSTNLRKPLQDAAGEVVSDSSSGLLCPFNAGTTTVSVRAGGFAYQQRVTVQPGSVQQPCGTRPLRPDRFARAPAPTAAPPAPPPAPAPAGSPPVSLPSAPATPASPPAATPAPPAPVPTPKAPRPAAPPLSPLPPPPALVATLLPAIVPPPPPPVVRPLPPGGVAARVYQVEEKREEDVATEESQAFSAHSAGDGNAIPPWSPALVLLAAAAGAGIVRRGRGGRRIPTPAPARAQDPTDHLTRRRTP